MFRMLTVIRDRRGAVWTYQFGRMYADDTGRVLRRMESLAVPLRGGHAFALGGLLDRPSDRLLPA